MFYADNDNFLWFTVIIPPWHDNNHSVILFTFSLYLNWHDIMWKICETLSKNCKHYLSGIFTAVNTLTKLNGVMPFGFLISPGLLPKVHASFLCLLPQRPTSLVWPLSWCLLPPWPCWCAMLLSWKFLPFFSLWKVFSIFGEFFLIRREVLGQGCHMCTDCKALWGKFEICDIGLYKINWIE